MLDAFVALIGRWFDQGAHVCPYRIAGDLFLAFSSPALFFRIITYGIKDVSLVSHILQLVVYASRYPELYLSSPTTGDSNFIKLFIVDGIAINLLTITHFKIQEIRSSTQPFDRSGAVRSLLYALFAILGSTCLAWYATDSAADTTMGTLRIFSMYLAVISLIPQLVMAYRAFKSYRENTLLTYLNCLAFFRDFHVLHWVLCHQHLDRIALGSSTAYLAVLSVFYSAIFIKYYRYFKATRSTRAAENQGTVEKTPAYMADDATLVVVH
ncbi:hypothetical protein BOTBODRAFT_31297 [Botryobasidium botryosum FD-172 SS1]|uniref:Uncharacterized protein n=1 Tax=Botryobasidium botryosum (strain FD-172 SS1) TaxID=930990 RepID=A0A067MJB9_BOTB1|nr:hypothetical protein BOTBODRAFT_31297 [Botryobasidium botryosum FD-172 SS1]